MPALSEFGRISCAHLPTPIEKLHRLSAYLGCQIWIKRDDCTGLAGGGNKVRKLEYLIADAQSKGADTIVTIGGMQSNHARQTAAFCGKYGLQCELILQDVAGTPKQNYYQSGNMLLNKLFAAKIHQITENENLDSRVTTLLSLLKQQGKTPYYIPLGGSNPLGCLGYVQCAYEIVGQASILDLNFDHIVLATGSGGTQAGLLAGLITAKCTTSVLGISVSRPLRAQQQLVCTLLRQTLELLNVDYKQVNKHVTANSDYYGKGYGITTSQTIDAIYLLAQLEGVLLDPVYTGKAMAGLINLCQQGVFNPKQNILFIHTGGSQGLFAYQEVF